MWTGNLLAWVLPPKGRPPSPQLQKLNALVHQEPYQTIIYHLYWAFFLSVVSPIAGICAIALGLARLVWELVVPPERLDAKAIQKTTGTELAVLVTGCDSGLGKELALKLAAEGFVVFAGCYQDPVDASPFAGSPRIRPLWMDVTNQAHVIRAKMAVQKWLDHAEAPNEKEGDLALHCSSNSISNNMCTESPVVKMKKRVKIFETDRWGSPTSPGGASKLTDIVLHDTKRVLFALVNNAGIARSGYVDWCTLSDYSACMEVNCFGQIRTVKAFLPIFKKQARDGSAAAPAMRIVNVNSMAGYLPSGFLASTPYEVSQNASKAFTDGLRLELGMFGVRVVSVDPSFHKTPMAEPSTIEPRMRSDVWEKLSPEKREEYGTDFFDTYVTHLTRCMATSLWDSATLLDAMVDQALLSASPPAQLVVGLDSKFSLAPMGMLPQWCRQVLYRLMMPPQVPAMMKKPGAKTPAKTASQKKNE